jgi:hypothetical protein
MPGETGVTVVTMSCASNYFARDASGASRARHSLRPLIGGLKEISGKPRAYRAARSWTRILLLQVIFLGIALGSLEPVAPSCKLPLLNRSISVNGYLCPDENPVSNDCGSGAAAGLTR